MLLVSFVGFGVCLVPSQESGWEERLRNDLFCVEMGRKTLLHTITYLLTYYLAAGRWKGLSLEQ